MRRTKAEAEQTRQTILDTALQLFDEKGYKATSLVQIAEAAEITRGAIYWHFKDKADILSALGEQYLVPHIQNMEKALNHENSWQESCDILTQILMEFEKPQHLHLAHICHTQQGIANENSDINNWIQHYGRIWREQMRTLIQRACQKGEIPNNTNQELAFLTIVCVIDGLIHQYADPLGEPPEQIKRYAPYILRKTFTNIAQGQYNEDTP